VVGEAQPGAVQREDGSWLLDGLMPVDEFKEILQMGELPGEHRGYYHTLGGFVMTRLGRIPSAADHFEWAKFRFEVMDMDGRRVDKVLVAPLALGAERPEPGVRTGRFPGRINADQQPDLRPAVPDDL
jgi:putative hemolysin